MNIKTDFSRSFYNDMAVCLISSNGNEEAIVKAARVSHGADIGDENEYTEEYIRKMIRMLLNNRHGTPFEFASFVFFLRVPLFVRSQIERYRHCSFVEKSFRSCEPGLYDFYYPDYKDDDRIEDRERFYAIIKANSKDCLMKYLDLRSFNVPKEDARQVLPNNLLTELVMTTNVRELIHIFEERLHPTAQYETRMVVREMFLHFEKLFPTIAEHLRENNKGILLL